ncbi:MAG: DUF2807 domain-containing protein [Saprospiraceae bacterium]|nr:DUF2807 domain-containing protein [Saprospiraceae bacterium]
MSIVKLLKAIIKPFFSLFLGIMLLVLGVLWAAWIISYINLFPFFNYLGPSPFIFSTIGGLAVFSTVAIPILGLMLLITRWFSSYRIPAKWRTNLRLGWLASFLIAVLSGFGTAISFNSEADLNERVEYVDSGEILKISELATKYNKPLGLVQLPDLIYTRGGLVNQNVSFDIVKSTTDKIILETRMHSHGKTFVDAQNLTKSMEIDHNFNENSLKIPKSFKIKRGSKFRGQRVEFVVHVPEGKNIEFDESIADIVWRSIDFRDGIRPKNLEKYVWTMTDKGLASVGWDKEYRAERFIDVKSLENLNIDGRIATMITYGNKPQILLKGPKTEIEKIEKVETDGTTSLIVNGWLSNRVQLEIVTPKLNFLQAKEVRSLKIEGFKQESMELNFSGERYMTDIKIYVDVENLNCNIGGANDVVLLGSGSNLTINVLDGSVVTAEQYKANNVEVKGNIYNNSSFYASESFICPPHERHSVTLYGDAELVEKSKTTQQ